MRAIWTSEYRYLLGRQRPRRRGPSYRTQQRVRWLTALVEHFGPGRVGGVARPFEPPPGWTFAEWRARERVR